MKADQICDKSVVWIIENDFNIKDAHFHLSRDNFCDIPSRQLELGDVHKVHCLFPIEATFGISNVKV